MITQYTAVVKQDGDWWVDWIEEVPGVTCQEPGKQALLESLSVTLRDAREINREEPLSLAGEAFEEPRIVLCSAAI